MREEFEKLPEISSILNYYDNIVFCEDMNQYKNNRVFWDAEIGFINGAWYAYQEQQAKIDKLLDEPCGGCYVE